MITKILKWGNSLGLRIPKSFANEAGIEEGGAVDISLDGDKIVIRRAKPTKYKLRDLLAQVRADNIHEEMSTGETNEWEIG